MPSYHRWYHPGATYFFTQVTYGRFDLFSEPEARRLLGKVMRDVSLSLPYQTLAIVLLPDHLHCLWSLPPGDDDFSTRWKSIKARFTEGWLASGGREAPVTRSERERGNRGVWQRRFWEHLIRDETDLDCYCDYIHYNPVKHGYVNWLGDWPWSSYRRFVREGHYPPSWGTCEPQNIAGRDWE